MTETNGGEKLWKNRSGADKDCDDNSRQTVTEALYIKTNRKTYARCRDAREQNK